ncbi:hypothetical protein ABZZ36_32370 [Actinacidiphila glaucinigra]|uniref:hypothetical protein n=1 Tax=Actinacidiphila glaucinigra TaxID=235986 RepID=UPI0033BB4F15
MPRIRRPRAADAFPYDLTPKTSHDTFAAAAAVLTARGWINGETFRMRPTSVRDDEVFLAPIVGGNDVSPGAGDVEWQDQEHRQRWSQAAHRLAETMTEAGWTAFGTTLTGTAFRRPDGPKSAPVPESVPDAADLATAPAGAPVRLLAIAAEEGIRAGQLDEAVREAVHDQAADAYNTGAHPELDDDGAHLASHADADTRAERINADGLQAQLAFLYAQCTSEAAFRALLRDLTS